MRVIERNLYVKRKEEKKKKEKRKKWSYVGHVCMHLTWNALMSVFNRLQT